MTVNDQYLVRLVELADNLVDSKVEMPKTLESVEFMSKVHHLIGYIHAIKNDVAVIDADK